MYGSMHGGDYLRPHNLSETFGDNVSQEGSLGSSWAEHSSTTHRSQNQSTFTAISPSIGFLYSLNYLIGNGFLVLPFAFYHAGLVFSCFTLVFISGCCCLTVFWTLDVMARAQAIEYFKETGAKFDVTSFSSKQSGLDQNIDGLGGRSRPLPIYEVQSERKFELAELCDLILGNSAKYTYIVAIFAYLIVTCWAYGTIAGVTWSTTIEWAPSGSFGDCKCNADDFTNVYMPGNGKCREAYWFYLALFSLIVIPLSCLDFRNQKVVQVSAAMFRILCVIVMTVQSLYDIINGIHDDTTPLNPTANSSSLDVSFNQTRNHHDKVGAFDVNIIHWLWAVPVIIHSQVLHQSVPSLSYRVREPWRYLSRIYVTVFVTSCIIDIVYGASVAGRYQERIMENSALNWAEQKHSPLVARRVLAYVVSLLPSLDVLSLYPMVVVTLADNVFFVAYGRDTSLSAQHIEHYTRKKTVLRFVLALVPMLCAMLIANLFYVTKYAGIVGVLVVFVFPALLQYKSRILCRKMFSTTPWRDRATEVAEGPSFSEDGAPVCCRQRARTIRERLFGFHDDEIETPYSTACSGRLSSCLAIVFAVAVACFTVAAFILNRTGSKSNSMT